jgi:large repetitive protein
MNILSRLKVGRACLAMSAVGMAVMAGGLGLSTASAAVATQTITFKAGPANAGAGTTYTPAATASSGLPVTFTIDATSSTVCSIAAGKVTFNSIGTCTIDGNQAGNAAFSPAPQVQQSITVAQGTQTITFTSTAPVGQFAGGPSYLVAASSVSGLSITFTVAPASSSVCAVTPPTPGGTGGSTGTVSGATVNFIGAGTCTLLADQPGNANFRSATQAQQSIPVSIGVQTVLFNSIAPSGGQTAKIGGTYGVRASNGSGITEVALAVAPSSMGVCSLSNVSGFGGLGGMTTGKVKFTGAGTCALLASAPGNNTFLPAPTVTQSFAVEKATAKSLTVSAKKQKAKLSVSGKLNLPAGVTAGKGYSGKITVTASKGKKTLSKKTVSLSKSGKYSVTLGNGTAATSVTVKFGGNSALTSSSAKKSL